jgi:hypothetical protein
MINVMGAPISDADAVIIVSYLSTHYGAQPAPSAKP